MDAKLSVLIGGIAEALCCCFRSPGGNSPMINTREPIKKPDFGSQLHYPDPHVTLETHQNPQRELFYFIFISCKNQPSIFSHSTTSYYRSAVPC